MIQKALRRGVGAVGADQHSVPTGPLAALALADEMQTMGLKVGGVDRAQSDPYTFTRPAPQMRYCTRLKKKPWGSTVFVRDETE